MHAKGTDARERTPLRWRLPESSRVPSSRWWRSSSLPSPRRSSPWSILERIETTLRWVVAAIFLALALAPAVGAIEKVRIGGHRTPRWLAILAVYFLGVVFFLFVLLQVIPPIVNSAEKLGSQLPTYVQDFETWAEGNEEFRELNDKYDITATLTEQAKSLPSHLGDAASEAGSLTVKLANDLVGGVTVLALAFLLLLDRGRLYLNAVARLPGDAAERGRRIGVGIYNVVRSYVGMTLVFAIAAGIFTWVMMEILGLDLAIPLAVIVGFCDLIPLVGLTLGGAAGRDRGGVRELPDGADHLGGRVPRLPAAPGPPDPAARLPARVACG